MATIQLRLSPASKGKCFVCGDEVYNAYPWWTGNPEKPGARPIHDECFTIWLRQDLAASANNADEPIIVAKGKGDV